MSRPRPARRCDLLVLGGGTAGLVAAKTAARLGATVVLVERGRTGGDCLWTGCVPSKALLAAAGAAAAARDGARLGVRVGPVEIDTAAVRAHVRAAIAAIEPADSVASLEAEGVQVCHGHARFLGPRAAQVHDTVVEFRQAVVATGAGPAIPPIPGLDRIGFWTSETMWDRLDVPARLAVLGGGAIGCEVGQAFARLGSTVTLVEVADRLLSTEDPDTAAAVHHALAADGVRIRVGQAAVAVRAAADHFDSADSTAGTVHLADGSEAGFDRLLVAVGRRPRTADLGLSAAGIAVDERGFVIVDDRLCTTNPRIRAAGDVTGHPQFTHVAGAHGSLAASNAVLGLRRRVRLDAVPRIVYTDPELAAVGAATDRAAPGGRILRLPHHELDRAVTEARTDGLTKISVDRRGRIVGASVVAPRAGEMLGELTLAVARGLRVRDLAAVVHPYPAWTDGPWKATLGDVRDSLARPPARWALHAAVWWRRRLLDRDVSRPSHVG